MNKFLTALVLAGLITTSLPAMADDVDASTKGDSYSKAARKEAAAPKTADDAAEVQQVIIEQSQINKAKAITEITPQPPADIKAEPSKTEPEVAKEPTIISKPLPEVSADSIGIAEGPLNLGSNLWQNTLYGTALRLVQGLAANTNSAVVQDLRARVLMTAAESPRENKANAAQAQLLQQRLYKLWSSGDFENYVTLSKLMHENAKTIEVKKNLAIISWFQGDDNGGCDIVERANSDNRSADADLAKMHIYCRVVREQKEDANLAFDLWREKNAATDPLFVGLMNGLLHNAKKPVADVKSMGLLHWLIAKKLGAAITADSPESINDMPTARLAVLTPTFNTYMRAAVTERLALQRKVTPLTLAASYADYPSDKLENTDSKQTPIQRRIAAWRKINQIEDAAMRANAVHDLIASPDSVGVNQQITMLVAAALIEKIPAEPELSWFAPDAVRALIAAGQFASAKNWMDVALADDTAAAKTWPYLRAMRLIDTTSPRGKLIMEKWAAYSIVANPKNLESQLGLVAMLIRAAGDNDDLFNRNLMPGGFSTEMLKMSDKKSASPALNLALSQAMQNFSRGEGILLCDYVLSSAPLSAIAAQNAAQCVEAFAKFGLQPESRYLAMEIFVAQGL